MASYPHATVYPMTTSFCWSSRVFCWCNPIFVGEVLIFLLLLIVCHTLRFRLHGTQTFHICHCRGHFPFNIFPTEEVGASKPTRTLRCKRLRLLCLHYFLDKDFVQLDPATAAQLILAAERLRSWAPLRYSIFTIYFHSQLQLSC